MILRRILRTALRSSGLLVFAALVLATPAAGAHAATPVPGSTYSYLQKDNIVMAEVDANGSAVTVTWVLKSGSGCTSEHGQALSSGQFRQLRVDAAGAFHATSRPWNDFPGVKYYLLATRGQFLAGGDSVRISVRQKSSTQTGSHWIRCTGKWLTFRACRSKNGACVQAHTTTTPAAKAKPKPTPTPGPPAGAAVPYQTGSYRGTTAQGEQIGFQVVNGHVQHVEFKASLQCSDGSSDTATAAVEDAAITGTHFDGGENADDLVSVYGDLTKGGQASGTVRVMRNAAGDRSCDSGDVSFTARTT